MNVLRWGANMLEGASPTGLILVGAVLAVTFPPVRKTLRGAAVVATRGVLKATDAVKDSMATMREGMQDVVAEARGPAAAMSAEAAGDGRRLSTGAKRYSRRMAVTAAGGALAMREGLRSIVAEARSNREAARQQQPADGLENIDLHCQCEPVAAAEPHADGLESPASDIGRDAPVKRTVPRRARARVKDPSP